MKRKSSKKAVIFLVIGALFILSAAIWYGYNLYEDKKAGQSAQALLQEVENLQKVEQNDGTILVDGQHFCGTIIIESLDIKLPVYDNLTYAKLKNAPCRYSGSLENDDMIIAAHNYKNHFRDLEKIKIGDEILFCDAAAIEHRYKVSERTLLDGTDVKDMKAGKWDFTLFTCTKSGKQRVTVRCEKVK